MNNSEQTDVAALAAGVMAVSVSVYTTQGAFDPIGIIVSATLFAIIIAFVLGKERTAYKSIALGMLFGLISIPVFGYIMEVYMRNGSFPIRGQDTFVESYQIVMGWSCVSVVTFLFDVLLVQKCLRKGPKNG